LDKFNAVHESHFGMIIEVALAKMLGEITALIAKSGESYNFDFRES
jgi:hypothetical protein